MNKEEKETLKHGYWLDLILKLKNLKSHNAKDFNDEFFSKNFK